LLHKLHQRHRQIPIDMHIETLASRQDVRLRGLTRIKYTEGNRCDKLRA
jgi:hypothetical protein